MLDNLGKKFKLLMPAYLLVGLGSMLFPLLLRWGSEQLGLNIIMTEHWEFVMPFVFAVILVVKLLRPRLALLEFNNQFGRFYCQFFVLMSLGFCGWALQVFYSNYTGTITKVSTAEQVYGVKGIQYFEFDKLDIVGSDAANHIDIRITNSRNNDLVFSMYSVIPLAPSYQTDLEHKVWLGFKHHTFVDASLPEADKYRALDGFKQRSWKDIEDNYLHHVQYMRSLPHSQDKLLYVKAIEKSVGSAVEYADITVMIPMLELNEEHESLSWFLGVLMISIVIFIGVLVRFPLSEHTISDFAQSNSKLDGVLSLVKMAFIPNKALLVVPLLISTNVIVFVLMFLAGVNSINPTGSELMEWGANRRTEVFDGQWWRLVSSMFLHSGIIHLLLNMYGLFMASLYVEPVLGKLRFVLLYFGAGIFASLSSVFWYEHVASVGASGAILGLFGAVIMLNAFKYFGKEYQQSVFMMFAPFIVISLLMGLFGGIDNAAHIGGLVSGAVIALVMYFGSDKKLNSEN